MSQSSIFQRIKARWESERYFLRTLGPVKYVKYYSYFHGGPRIVELKRPGNTRRAYVSYVPEALIRDYYSPWMNGHQNRREMVKIADVLLRNGYDVCVQDYEDRPRDLGRFDLIFGHSPLIDYQMDRNPGAKSVLYGTTAYLPWHFKRSSERLAEFSEKYGVTVSDRRVEKACGVYGTVDAILQIGSKFTLESFPAEYRGKITLINQSSNYRGTPDIEGRIAGANPRKFLWIGSLGSIQKGFDLVVEYFLAHPELEIDMVGIIDKEVLAVFADRLKGAKNIRLHGFMDVNSPEFERVTRDTAFHLFPSCTEGSPGALIVTMKMGIITLASRMSAHDGIDTYGHMIQDETLEAIDEAVRWSQALSADDRARLMRANATYARRWTLAGFEREFEHFIQSLQQ